MCILSQLIKVFLRPLLSMIVPTLLQIKPNFSFVYFTLCLDVVNFLHWVDQCLLKIRLHSISNWSHSTISTIFLLACSMRSNASLPDIGNKQQQNTKKYQI